jgi:ATP-dependent Clp protease adaptor protein ClpS
MSSKTETKVRIQPNVNLEEPPLFKIIYVNDDQTSMEFVISSLIEFFDYTENSAEELTHNIHNEGSAVVAVLPYEIAEQKGIEVTLSARGHGYPLQIKVEAEHG